jgi:aminoglycoside phosphotransferase (APT) family kinase protein
LEWVCASLGDGARILSVEPLLGSTTAALHALCIRTGAGVVRELVLRRYVWADYLVSEGDPPSYETTALRLLGASTVPAPRLLAADVQAEHCDAPAVLMTRIPGQPRHRPDGMTTADFLRGLAEPLPLIHAVPVPDGMLRPYRPYLYDRPMNPPRWARRPEVWEQAIEIHLGPIPADGPPRLIHRDYHPGNVLWADSVVQGVVDWANTTVVDCDAACLRW